MRDLLDNLSLLVTNGDSCDSAPAAAQTTVVRLIQLVEEKCATATESPAAPTLMISDGDELRLQLVAAALWTMAEGLGSDELLEFMEDIAEDAARTIGDVSEFPGGLLSAQVGSHVVVLFREPEAVGRGDELASAFFELFNSTPTRAKWILDLSTMHCFPTEKLGVLFSFENQLRYRGGEMLLGWVQSGLFPEALFRRMIRIFNLKDGGSHYFSKPRRS